MPLRTRGAVVVLACVLASAGCSRGSRVLVVGSKNSTDQVIVGEILAQYLEKRLGTERVGRRLGLPGTQLTHESLLTGAIDIYPEYTGAALSTLLKGEPAGTREAVRDRVQEEYRARFRCEWIGPLGYENRFAAAVLRDTAEKLNLKTISDAEAYELGWSLTVLPEFQDRADGQPQFMRTYRLRLGVPIRSTEAGSLYAALDVAGAAMVAGQELDAALSTGAYVALEDNRRGFSFCEAGLVTKSSTLEEEPALAGLLRGLSGKFDTARMRAMVKEVEVDKRAPETVAAEFLKQAKL
ncbi:MAG: hypothetical protein HZB13_06375 [Acidobacteria bacterium]|nr:hypothetical protein [Acidobacteriota bacterium]